MTSKNSLSYFFFEINPTALTKNDRKKSLEHHTKRHFYFLTITNRSFIAFTGVRLASGQKAGQQKWNLLLSG
jgi:hypothetical protein